MQYFLNPKPPQPKGPPSDNPLMGYDGKLVPHTCDPSAWARHFCQTIFESRKMQLDVLAVESWFRKAIERGRKLAAEDVLVKVGQTTEGPLKQAFDYQPPLPVNEQTKEWKPDKTRISVIARMPMDVQRRLAQRCNDPTMDYAMLVKWLDEAFGVKVSASQLKYEFSDLMLRVAQADREAMEAAKKAAS